jgi:catechol 2,3-dioxygenase-like lactoylglutathione lyase family enzyme
MKATKRLHISVGVEDLDASIRFYAALFGAPPTVVKDDYAKWMLDDPRVNFSLSSCCGGPGLSHLGVQVEDGEELSDISARLRDAGLETNEQHDVNCCYTRQDKTWVRDPQGLRWEAFVTHGEHAGTGCCA